MRKEITCPACGQQAQASGEVRCLCDKDFCTGQRCGAYDLARDFTCSCGASGKTPEYEQYQNIHMGDIIRQVEEETALKSRLDDALAAWDAARVTAGLNVGAWNILLGSHQSLIGSLRQHGHSLSAAQATFDGVSDSHKAAVLAAWTAMDDRCREYQALLREYEALTADN